MNSTKGKTLAKVATAAAIILFPLCGHASGFTLKGTVWEAEARQCDLDPRLLYAVALVESKAISKRMAAPSPLAMNVDGKGIHPVSRQEAEKILAQAVQRTPHIAVGAMQVSLRWNGSRVASPEQLLDLKTNVRIGTEILCEMIDGATSNEDLAEAVGRYHTPNPNKRDVAGQYGRSVLAIWRRLILISKEV